MHMRIEDVFIHAIIFFFGSKRFPPLSATKKQKTKKQTNPKRNNPPSTKIRTRHISCCPYKINAIEI